MYVARGDENRYLYSSRAIIEEFNILTDERPDSCTCKFRYRSKDVEIRVKYLENGDLELKYDHAKAVTPGQFCCLYQGELCLGGGIIKEVF